MSDSHRPQVPVCQLPFLDRVWASSVSLSVLHPRGDRKALPRESRQEIRSVVWERPCICCLRLGDQPPKTQELKPTAASLVHRQFGLGSEEGFCWSCQGGCTQLQSSAGLPGTPLGLNGPRRSCSHARHLLPGNGRASVFTRLFTLVEASLGFLTWRQHIPKRATRG